MFDVVRKDAYWAALDSKEVFQKLGGFTLKALDGLKHIQDAWTIHALLGTHGARILEVGGGVSRVLPALDDSNERWNLDEFKGEGNGVTVAPDMPGIRLVQKKLGDFSDEIPSDYFDIVFSISVVEHLPSKVLDSFWRDHARILKIGGVALHTIDLYLNEARNENTEGRLDLYRELSSRHGLELVDVPRLARPAVFSCDMASNSDWGMWRWNKNVPSLSDVRRTSQSVTLGMKIRRVR